MGDDEQAMSFLKMPIGRPFKKLTERELIQLESEVGKNLFGPIPRGHRREFFNLDNATWIWHEEFIDGNRKRKSITTRYEIQDRGILKVQDGSPYSYLEGQELENFAVSVQMYYEQVARKVYGRDPRTGQKLR